MQQQTYSSTHAGMMADSLLSGHLLSTLPITTLGTFNFRRRASEQHRDTAWSEYIDHVGSQIKQPFGWIRADETDELGNRHIHAAFVSYMGLNDKVDILHDSWLAVNDYKEGQYALVSPYQAEQFGTSGLDYLLSPSSAVSFSPNIPLFSSLTDVSMLQAADRRTYGRMRGL
jgi:hypothetical protein